ncbi:thioesterase family protein [Salinifilum aidingensis]
MTRLAPLHQQVRPEWIDYNGHLTEGYYGVVFGHASDNVLEQLGFDADYRERTGCSVYTVEAHVRFLREVPPDSDLVVTSRVVEAGGKKLRVCHEMHAGEQLRATQEAMLVHVDSTAGRAAPFPDGIAEELARHVEPLPDYAGRAIS